MIKDSENSALEPAKPHRCNLLCLGPLTFHSQAVGTQIHLSQGGRHAERNKNTFKNGLVFSSRPVKIQERIRVRVQKDALNWEGALRVGFTNVSPSARSLPLPSLAIPDLSSSPGHWAAPVHESCCLPGSELEFWVSAGSSLYCKINNRQHKLLSGVDLSKPLWAMIDVYGQTCAISLIRSEKRALFGIRRSCPAPEDLATTEDDKHQSLKLDESRFSRNSDDCISFLSMEVPSEIKCVVCMVKEARVKLPCGHQCLCKNCSVRVMQEFNSCPLCRRVICSLSVHRSLLEVV